MLQQMKAHDTPPWMSLGRQHGLLSSCRRWQASSAFPLACNGRREINLNAFVLGTLDSHSMLTW